MKLTRDDFAEQFQIPKSTLRNYELGERTPNIDGLAAFVRAGINANWLLTGNGPMLLADLLSLKNTSMPSAPTAPAQINEIALAQAIEVMQATAPKGETQAVTARRAVQFYMFMEEKGFLTPEGFSPGAMDTAA